jgi:hypothetical protein
MGEDAHHEPHTSPKQRIPPAYTPPLVRQQTQGNRINRLVRYDINDINVWYQLTCIKYKVASDKVLQIEPKGDLTKRTGKSPDFAESAMLTFVDPVGRPGIRLLAHVQ